MQILRVRSQTKAKLLLANETKNSLDSFSSHTFIFDHVHERDFFPIAVCILSPVSISLSFSLSLSFLSFFLSFFLSILSLSLSQESFFAPLLSLCDLVAWNVVRDLSLTATTSASSSFLSPFLLFFIFSLSLFFLSLSLSFFLSFFLSLFIQSLLLLSLPFPSS